MEYPVTPRMVIGMEAEAIARSIAAFHQAGHLDKTDSRYHLLGMADGMAQVLRLMVSKDEADALIVKHVNILEGCVALMRDPQLLGREVDAWLKTNQNAA